MPAGAIYVGRPTRWANPWPIDWMVDGMLTAHELTSGNGFMTRALAEHTERLIHPRTLAREAVVELYHSLALALRRHDPAGFCDWIDPLIGHDLACWCLEGERCHADVLLALANADPLIP